MFDAYAYNFKECKENWPSFGTTTTHPACAGLTTAMKARIESILMHFNSYSQFEKEHYILSAALKGQKEARKKLEVSNSERTGGFFTKVDECSFSAFLELGLRGTECEDSALENVFPLMEDENVKEPHTELNFEELFPPITPTPASTTLKRVKTTLKRVKTYGKNLNKN